ncbi:hypothetical protein L226DRAFT_612036 [Lentinus tigrinus ALCF2SS1-7]|uniref:Fungal-type protein kinase domain-containing protein n=1 Tax=Lentinus tigrinus ALCF2SS1-6 TaxID=1328759 RepID=A0A5C2SB14_9APHY|nr:hypothetical protein L227DRAFT_575087 [Lentinus tigrinus ALCF2SS1-6]RPD75710.1 hypothetical protein L226DRAFT_612036 [Lentinus tigrinus ALCF2SS1-7]
MTDPELEQPPTDAASPSVPAATTPEPAASGADAPQAAPARPSRVREVTTRSLSEFTDTKHLVTVMLDAIKAHKSLYEVGGVLHGDINNNTIIILQSSDGESNGALVDFDLPYSMPAVRKLGDPHPPIQRNRPYYWRAPGV